MSDPYHDLLFPALPLEEAAGAFLRIKHAGRAPQDPAWDEAVKQASSEYANMTDEDLGGVAAGAHLPGRAGAVLGGIAGAARGFRQAPHAGSPLRAAGTSVLNTLGGMALGRTLGNAIVDPGQMQDLERERQARATANAIGRAPMPEEAMKEATERMKIAFASMAKKADEGEGDTGGAEMVPPSPPVSPDTQKFLTLERMGGEIEEQRASDYYAQRLREKAEEMGLMQQQLQEMQAGADDTAGQLDGMQQAQGVAEQASQVAKQQALESAQQAHAAAEQAMAQTVQATADATQAKLQLQEMRARMLELAGQDPGIAGLGSPGQVPGAGQAMPGNPQDPNSVSGAGMPGQDPNQQPGQPGQDQNAQQAQPGQPAAGGDTAGAAPASSGSDSSSSDSSGGGSSSEGSNSGKVQVKVGARKTAAHPALLGGLIGGAAGAGLAGMEAMGHGPDPEAQQGKVEELEQASGQPGLKGFGAAFELAKERAMQTLGNATRQHPALATLAGGAIGAGVGASMGPGIASHLGEAVSNYR